MYTLEMQRAFHSITAPTNFEVQLYEHNVEGLFFIEIVADEQKFVSLAYEDKLAAIEYMIRVKDALEHNGAIVQLTRKAVPQ